MEQLLNAWSRRKITLFGKITVIKTLVISKITHLLTNLPDPDEVSPGPEFVSTQISLGWQT